jgi:predicted methyltransferase
MKYIFKITCLICIIFYSQIENTLADNIKLNINTKNSLLRIGINPASKTDEGTKIAERLYDALEVNDMKMLKRVSAEFKEIQKKENHTLDYSSLKWLCDRILEENNSGRVIIADKLSLDFYKYFVTNKYLNLKEYLLIHYGIKSYKPSEDDSKLNKRTVFLEDLIMFNDPSRDTWDVANDIMYSMNIKKGQKVIDIGSGFGYYSNKFSNIVGDEGIVYSVDTNNMYVDYVKEYIYKNNIKNIIPVNSTEKNINVDEKVDVIYISSLYHIIYGWSQEQNRKEFISSIKQSLKDGGKIFIIDNKYCNGNELNNCYIYKELIISQLEMYGFRFDKFKDLSSNRYLLEFTKADGNIKELYASSDDNKNTENDTFINIKDTRSIIHIGSLDSYDTTEKGILGAKMVLNVLNNKNVLDANNAVKYYENLIPNENFGGEYTALQWFCKYIGSSNTNKNRMLSDPLVKSYYEYLGADDYAYLKNYLVYKYKIKESNITIRKSIIDKEDTREIGRTKRAFIEDFILFNNPQRELWEKSTEILSHLPIEKSNIVVDLGSGSGYYSYRFSKIVGDKGKVYAIDNKIGHLDFINTFTKQNQIKNIITIKAEDNQGYKIPEKADYVYTCSLYHVVYGVFSEQERSLFINSIKESLKDNGRLIIVDNSPVNDTTLPYHGPYISKELIISQLSYYGFEPVEFYQDIPQRYIIIFKIKNRSL